MKVGELTLNEVADICKKCDMEESSIEFNCPFTSVILISCNCTYADTHRRIGLNDELVVDETCININNN